MTAVSRRSGASTDAGCVHLEINENSKLDKAPKAVSQCAKVSEPPVVPAVPCGCCLLRLTFPYTFRWIVDMEGAPGTLYEGEKFQLLFKFSSRYPFDSPQVMFTGDNIPVHPHVYSNGHICLSILTEDWSPALSVQSVCLSIISMLSSSKEKVPWCSPSVYKV
ncbi:unnamed protein product [Ranitomeya imitator]|uniref:UBC core domain-containing protein n=1 Tax=Ranitomeya imitator TaxID=111125 RepID=A0ABN9KXN5_9NEOB|nr:unnamed protein product [Ranitomeya imitator]